MKENPSSETTATEAGPRLRLSPVTLECPECQRRTYADYHNFGAESAGDRAATMHTIIETAKLNDINPEAYLRDLITRIADHSAKRIAELLPWTPIIAEA